MAVKLNSLKDSDPTIFNIISDEEKRQLSTLQLIASENFTSVAVREAVGSVLMHKYSEGQVGKRYYQGNENIDKIESLAKHRALELFKLSENDWGVNVQAVTGSVANLAVYSALLEPGDKIMAMNLYHGGHLSHGWKIGEENKVSFSSRVYDSYFYNVSEKTYTFDYDEIEALVSELKPKIIISGGTAYPREINHSRFSEIAQKVGAYYLADIAHEAGLVATGVNSSPFEHAHIVTMTTRKTLRGPVGSLIFSRKDLNEKIDRGVFPSLQGGPQNHSIAGIAVALKEANSADFIEYSRKTVSNAQTLASNLADKGYKIISGGTDKHLFLVDVSDQKMDGWYASLALEKAGIIVNRTTIPFDTKTPYYPSGIRIGTPFVTTLGLDEKDMPAVAEFIDTGLKVCAKMLEDSDISRKDFKVFVSESDDLQEVENDVRLFMKDFLYE